MANYKKQLGLVLADSLRKAVLQAAIQGQLVAQQADDGDASELLVQIQAEKRRLIDEKVIKKDKPLADITDDEKPFDIPDNWVWVRLGDITDYGQGRQTMPKDIPLKSLVIEMEDIEKDTFILLDKNYSRKPKSSKNAFKKGDILYGKLRPYLRKIIIADEDGYCSTEIIPFNGFNLLDNRYLRICLASPFVNSLVNSVTHGMDMPRLGTDKARNILIPLPPLAEQERIVAKLDEILPQLDELSSNETTLNALQSAFPKQMQSALLQSAISGKLTEQLTTDGNASDLLTQIQAEKKRLIDEKVIKREKPLADITDDEKPFDIPDNWVWVKLGQIVTYSMGKTPPRTSAEYWQNDYPWVSIADMIENGNITSTKEKVSQSAYDNIFKKNISKVGTMIMSFKLTIGRVSILDIDAFHNEAIISIYPSISADKVEILQSYLFKILPYISNWGDSKKAIKGNTLNSDSISNMLIPLPPLAEQKRIVAKLDELLPQVQSLII